MTPLFMYPISYCSHKLAVQHLILSKHYVNVVSTRKLCAKKENDDTIFINNEYYTLLVSVIFRIKHKQSSELGWLIYSY